MSNSFVAVADNPWALLHNPAGLTQLRRIEASMFFIPEQFGLSELRTVSLAVAIPWSFGTVGFSLEQFGFDLYRENNFSIGIGRVIDGGISGGLTLNLHRISIERYGAATAATLDIGLLGQVQDNLTFGFAYKNISASTIGASKERLPQILYLGLKYSSLSDFVLTAELEKDIRFPFVIKAGIEYKVMNLLNFRFGVSNNPDKFAGGMSVRYSLFEFGYAGYSHPQLGWTHQVELSVRMND